MNLPVVVGGFLSHPEMGDTPEMGRPRTTPPTENPVDGLNVTAHPVNADYDAGYKAGYAVGFEEASRQSRPPLFEAARAAVLANYLLSRDDLKQVLFRVEQEYAEQLRQADRDLILGLAERERTVARARQSAGSKPRSSRPSESFTGRKPTEYEQVV